MGVVKAKTTGSKALPLPCKECTNLPRRNRARGVLIRAPEHQPCMAYLGSRTPRESAEDTVLLQAGSTEGRPSLRNRSEAPGSTVTEVTEGQCTPHLSLGTLRSLDTIQLSIMNKTQEINRPTQWRAERKPRERAAGLQDTARL